MKKGIHPEYHRIMVKCTSCGAEFETGSTSKELRVDTCSNCHPFYTGRQRFAAAQGRIEKDVRDLLLHRDVLKNSTKNTDLNNNNYNRKEAYASFLLPYL